MPGIATQFEILRLTLERMKASGDPNLVQIAQVMEDNPAFAHLGAIGPALGDFIPSDRPPDPRNDPNPYALLWKQIFGIMGGEHGIYANLKGMTDILCKMEGIAYAEDVSAICEIKDSGEFEQIDQATTAFSNQILDIKNRAALDIFNTIVNIKPNVCTETPTDPVPESTTWQIRDFLHWKKSGRFVKTLIRRAQESGDNHFLAYAYGYLISYVGNVCGSPFINSATGGPSRTQWWRQRFVKNYVDSWVYGFYRANAQMNGDEPSVPYADWPNLCEANLQQQIQLDTIDQTQWDQMAVQLMNLFTAPGDFPAVLPDDFANFWFSAFQEAYGPVLPNLLPVPGVLNGAYLMTWLVLWFQTSGQVLGCNLQVDCCCQRDPMEPPDNCGDAPSALDPFQIDPTTGDPILPPPAQVDYDTDAGAVACGIILGILGFLALCSGNTAAGAVIIAGAVDQFDCRNILDVNWQQLRCLLYWYRLYMYNGLKGLHKLFALAGIGYPDTSFLAVDTDVLDVLNLVFESGKNVVKSRGRDQEFPSKPWDGGLTTFNQRPTATSPGFETPRTFAYLTAAYPSFFIDDDINNPLANGDVKTGGSFPYRRQTPSSALPVQFGNAVANCIDIFKNLDADFPLWNMDGDRGLAFFTWQFQGFYDPDNVTIEPEP